MADKPRAKVTFRKRPQKPVVGPQGEQGIQGEQGEPGVQGDVGQAGADGSRGLKGDAGVDGLAGERGQRGLRGAKGAKGDKGDPGAPGVDGKDGAPGTPGADGATGKSAFDIWLEAHPGKSKRDYLKAMKPTVGAALEVLGGGGGRAAVQQLREELEDSVGHSHAPKSATLTRDISGSVETVTVEGENTWTLSRNPNGSVASLTDTVYNVAVDRDVEGVVTGVTVT